MLERISSRQNAKIKAAALLKDGKGPSFLVEGFHLVEMALESGAAETIFVMNKPLKTAIPQYLVTKEIIEKLASTRSPEGVIAICKKREPLPFREPYILALERISDPGNLGTCLRTALAFGFKDVLLHPLGASPYNAKALLASQGAIFKLNIAFAADFPSSLSALKEDGYPLIATSLKGNPLEKAALPAKGVLVLGNEARGVSNETIARSDMALRISIEGIDSLNVGVACGILMHAFKNRSEP